MPIRKPKFDWSLLDKYSLYAYFRELAPELINQPLTPTQFHHIVSKHVKKYLPVRISKQYDFTVESGWVYVGGTYNSDFDKSKQKCIELQFVYNTLDKKITYSKLRFNRMCYIMVDVILHELIHMRQYRRRKFKYLPDYASTAEKTEQRQEQSYLGCSDEIDAYAFNIACELLRKFNDDQPAVEKYLGRRYTNKKVASHSLKSYLKAFNWDYDHKIIKRLKSKTIRYLPNAIYGKPYRNKDWISR